VLALRKVIISVIVGERLDDDCGWVEREKQGGGRKGES
jgi:hypothetical protein